MKVSTVLLFIVSAAVSANDDTTTTATLERSSPGRSLRPQNVFVAQAETQSFVPTNCCEFIVRLSVLDDACNNAARNGRTALMLQEAVKEYSCELPETPSESIESLQATFKKTRTKYRKFLKRALKKKYPGVTQKCFEVHPPTFTFACERRYVDPLDFEIDVGLDPDLDHIEDYLCCASPQPRLLNNSLANLARGNSTPWCGGSTIPTPRCVSRV
jgi:hypothetical protein